MSMICDLRRASDAEIAHLLANPEYVHAFLYGVDDEEDRSDLDIDKAWHGMHFLLTGTAEDGEPPLNFLVAGGTEVGDVDIGYGPARAFTSRQVREIAGALAGLTSDDLRHRFDPQAMEAQRIYPKIWTRPSEQDDTLGYVIEYFETLTDYIATLARDGLGMLVYLH